MSKSGRPTEEWKLQLSQRGVEPSSGLPRLPLDLARSHNLCVPRRHSVVSKLQASSQGMCDRPMVCHRGSGVCDTVLHSCPVGKGPTENFVEEGDPCRSRQLAAGCWADWTLDLPSSEAKRQIPYSVCEDAWGRFVSRLAQAKLLIPYRGAIGLSRSCFGDRVFISRYRNHLCLIPRYARSTEYGVEMGLPLLEAQHGPSAMPD
jgi:hypothetical protein